MTNQQQLINTTKLLQITLQITNVLNDTEWWVNQKKGNGYVKPLYNVNDKSLMWVDDVNQLLTPLTNDYNKSPLTPSQLNVSYQLLITYFKSHSKLPPTTINRIYDDKLILSKSTIKSSLTKSINKLKKQPDNTEWDLFTHNLSTLHSILSCL